MPPGAAAGRSQAAAWHRLPARQSPGGAGNKAGLPKGHRSAGGRREPQAGGRGALPPRTLPVARGPRAPCRAKKQLRSAGASPPRTRVGKSGPGRSPGRQQRRGARRSPLFPTRLSCALQSGTLLSRPPRLPSAQNQLTPSARPPAKGKTGGAGADRRQSLINERLLQ